MKTAYDGEFQGLLRQVDTTRGKMEAWYALRLDDDHVVGEYMDMYKTIMAEFDSTVATITGSTKLVKNAIVPLNQFIQIFFCFLTTNGLSTWLKLWPNNRK